MCMDSPAVREDGSKLYRSTFRYMEDNIDILAVAADGAKDLALAMSTCKKLKEVAEDSELLTIVNFQNLKLNDHTRSFKFHHLDGLLSNCVQAGNESANFVLAKTILFGSFPVWERIHASTIDQRIKATGSILDLSLSSNMSSGSLHHLQLVRSFLCTCSSQDFHFVSSELNEFVKCFACLNGFHMHEFIRDIKEMSILSEDNERGLKEIEHLHDFKKYYVRFLGYSEGDWMSLLHEQRKLIESREEEFEVFRCLAVSHFDHMFSFDPPCFLCRMRL